MADGRELIRGVLRGERSTRLPHALFGGGRWSYQQTGLRIEELDKNPDRFAKALSVFFRGLDTDIVFPGSGLNSFPAEAIGGELAFRHGQAPLLSFPLIEKAEDARYLKTVDISLSPHTLALMEMIAILREHLQDRFLCATSWGPFTWAMILCEDNLLLERTVTDREFVLEVCELGVRLSWAFFAPLIRRGLIDGIVISDGATTLIPLDLYREIVLPCERKIFQRVKELGASGFLHQCGDIHSQVALYPETGADCVSVDTGVSIGEVYELYHKQLVTAGNVDVISVVFGGKPSLLCNRVLECVAEIPDPYLNYILMPSCDLPLDTPLRNVKEFLACAERLK